MWDEVEMWYKENRDTPVSKFSGSFDDSVSWTKDNVDPLIYRNESYIVLDEENRSLMVKDADNWFMIITRSA